jgi:hypothetical protein
MRFLLTYFLFLCFSASFSQNSNGYQNIRLTTPSEFRKAEAQVILASDFILSMPIEKKNPNRDQAMSFIMKWMQGTPDYSFVLDESIAKITAGDNELMGIYLAALASTALSKGKEITREELRIGSYARLADYCSDPAHNYKPKGEVKKLIEARKQNTLAEYLDSKKK